MSDDPMSMPPEIIEDFDKACVDWAFYRVFGDFQNRAEDNSGLIDWLFGK